MHVSIAIGKDIVRNNHAEKYCSDLGNEEHAAAQDRGRGEKGQGDQDQGQHKSQDPIQHNIYIFEIFSPLRLKDTAEEMGLGTGYSVDRLVVREDGDCWDLRRPEHQRELLQLLRERRPDAVVLSPPCTAFSQMQNINKHRMDSEIWDSKVREGIAYLDYTAKIIKEQIRLGGVFVFEHPRNATSWGHPGLR